MAFHMTRSLIHLNGMIQMTIPHVKAVAAAVCVASLPSLGHAAEQDTVVVTATGFEQKIQDAPASISVITKQQIEDKAYRDVTDALKDVPGVVVTGGEQQRYQYSRYGFAIHALPRSTVNASAPAAHVLIATTQVLNKVGCRRLNPSSVSKSSVARCHHYTAPTRWAVSLTSSPRKCRIPKPDRFSARRCHFP